MRIEYRANGQQREVRDKVGAVLIARNIAKRVPAVQAAPVSRDIAPEADPAGESRPRRKYKRRDIVAED